MQEAALVVGHDIFGPMSGRVRVWKLIEYTDFFLTSDDFDNLLAHPNSINAC